MVFMIGVGWDNGGWHYRSFAAEREERAMVEAFVDWMETETGGAVLDASRTSLYHWTSAEVWQVQRVAARHQLPSDHPLCQLPWFDLQKVLLDGPAALPGAWNYGLKSVASALDKLDPSYGTAWPEDLDAGLQAMVMGWRAYATGDPMGSEEMALLKRYLEGDCRALWQILRWLRAGQ
jgi:uncharacterized protein